MTDQGKPERKFMDILRTAARIALVVGATGCLIFMFRAGQQTPRLLLLLFTLWVLTPFAVLLWAAMASKRWSVLTRGTLYCVTIIVALSSLAIYSGLIDVRPAGSANAFLYVAVPPVSLIFLSLVILIAALISGRRSPRGS